MSKMRIITHAELPLGYAMAQTNHAAFEFAATHPEITKEWMETSNTIVVLTTVTSEELQELHANALAAELPLIAFYEPDLDNALTAVALAPSAVAEKLTAHLSLAGKIPTNRSISC